MRHMLKWTLTVAMIFSASVVLAQEAAPKQCDFSEMKNQEQQRRRPPHHDNLTDEQRACLEDKLGKPGEGPRPTHEEFESAHAECGISVPDLPAEQE